MHTTWPAKCGQQCAALPEAKDISGAELPQVVSDRPISFHLVIAYQES